MHSGWGARYLYKNTYATSENILIEGINRTTFYEFRKIFTDFKSKILILVI